MTLFRKARQRCEGYACACVKIIAATVMQENSGQHAASGFPQQSIHRGCCGARLLPCQVRQQLQDAIVEMEGALLSVKKERLLAMLEQQQVGCRRRSVGVAHMSACSPSPSLHFMVQWRAWLFQHGCNSTGQVIGARCCCHLVYVVHIARC